MKGKPSSLFSHSRKSPSDYSDGDLSIHIGALGPPPEEKLDDGLVMMADCLSNRIKTESMGIS